MSSAMNSKGVRYEQLHRHLRRDVSYVCEVVDGTRGIQTGGVMSNFSIRAQGTRALLQLLLQ